MKEGPYYVSLHSDDGKEMSLNRIRLPQQSVDYEVEPGDSFWKINKIEEVGDGDGVLVEFNRVIERYRFKDGSVVDIGGVETAVRLTGDDLRVLYGAITKAKGKTA